MHMAPERAHLAAGSTDVLKVMTVYENPKRFEK